MPTLKSTLILALALALATLTTFGCDEDSVDSSVDTSVEQVGDEEDDEDVRADSDDLATPPPPPAWATSSCRDGDSGWDNSSGNWVHWVCKGGTWVWDCQCSGGSCWQNGGDRCDMTPPGPATNS